MVYQSLLRRRNIRVVSVTEPEFDERMAILVEPILAAVDEFMTHQIAEDTCW